MVRSSQKGGSSSSMNPARPRRADTGVWPCTLDGCSKVFAREADLKRHQRTTKSHLVPGSGVGSPCPLCEATFTRTDAMRRHLKSRHNGKTPETLHLQDTQTVPSASSSRSKRRESSISDLSELSSEGEQEQHQGHQRSETSSRAQSAAPVYYEQPPHHAPPPPNNLSPAILYQAAMSYEIRHALSPSSPTPSSLSGAHVPRSPPLRTSNPSRNDVYPQPPGHGPFTQFPADDYSYHSQHQQAPYSTISQQNPQHFASASHAGPMYNNGIYGPSRNSGSPSPYVQNTWGQRQGPSEDSSGAVKAEDEGGTMQARRSGGRRGPSVNSPRSPFAQHEPPPTGLVALAMHAARIRPMSPLPNGKQTVKTKSELESALGPTRTYSR